MKKLTNLFFSFTALSILSMSNAHSDEVAERGGGGGARNYSHENSGNFNRDNNYHQERDSQYHPAYNDAYRRDANFGGYYGPGYGSGYGGVPAAYPTGYPAWGYPPPGYSFPDQAQQDATYRQNQHPPQ